MTERSDVLDWSSGKRLHRLKAAGVKLSHAALHRLNEIALKHPDWKFDETERSEFSIWTGSSVGERGDTSTLKGVGAADLLPAIRQKMSSDRFSFSGLWRNLTQDNPVLAFEALVAEAKTGNSDPEEWQQLFYKLREETSNRELDEQVLYYLSNQQLEKFLGALSSIASWLRDKRSSIETSAGGWERLLVVWDGIAELIQECDPEADDDDDLGDVMMAVWNETPGVLTELLAQKLADLSLTKNSKLPNDIASRLETAINWSGVNGLIAQCALMQRLPWMEQVVPDWTWRCLIPLLQSDQANWQDRWRARFYHTSLGTRKLFEETKDAFLATFSSPDHSEPNGGQTLLLVRAAYQASRAKSKWAFAPSEAREAVAAGGSALMREITRTLAYRESEDTPEKHWREVVLPIFQFLWPRNASSQTQETSKGLIKLAFASGESFPAAIDTFAPYLKPWSGERPWDFEFLFDDQAIALLCQHPNSAIRLLDAYISGDSVPVKLNELLDHIEAAQKDIAHDRSFAVLRGLARRSAA